MFVAALIALALSGMTAGLSLPLLLFFGWAAWRLWPTHPLPRNASGLETGDRVVLAIFGALIVAFFIVLWVRGCGLRRCAVRRSARQVCPAVV